MFSLYDGYYINLDRSPDRRANMERQFDAFGLGRTYRRFAAIDGATWPPRPGIRPGERGIFQSHISVLAEGGKSGRPIHIVEDDIILSPYAAPAINLIVRNGVIDQYDLIFSETLVPPDLRALRQFKSIYDKAMVAGMGFNLARLQIIDLATIRFSGATSYVVNPRSVERILGIYQEHWAKGPVAAFDFVLREEVQAGRLKAACAFPFVTSIDLDGIVRSTAGRLPASPDEVSTGLVMALLRYSFYVGRDLEFATVTMNQILERTFGRELDLHRVLIEQAVGFILSDRFNVF